jgi:hypothetical protein
MMGETVEMAIVPGHFAPNMVAALIPTITAARGNAFAAKPYCIAHANCVGTSCRTPPGNN